MDWQRWESVALGLTPGRPGEPIAQAFVGRTLEVTTLRPARVEVLDVAGARRLFAYNEAVSEGYLRGLERLGWPAATRNRGSGHLSLKNTLVHILQVHDIWINYVFPGRLEFWRKEGVRDPDTLKEWAEVRAFHRRVWEGVHRYLSRLTRRELRRHVRAPWMPGTYTVSDALLQTSLEQAHHVGEMIAIYWQMDLEPPTMMWIPIGNRLKRRGAAKS
jgi:uncharacterized damage-inducible protein DinB